jgi:hypothetical protein
MYIFETYMDPCHKVDISLPAYLGLESSDARGMWLVLSVAELLSAKFVYRWGLKGVFPLY